MKSITHKTLQLIEKCFPASEKNSIISLLIDECENNLPFHERSDSVALERFHFAVIKLSNGDISKLKQAIELAKTDWRDLLVRAGFANEINAHDMWASTIL